VFSVQFAVYLTDLPKDYHLSKYALRMGRLESSDDP
jgi:hypothetical protein